MQEFFHRKVYLETFVRVEPEWSDSPDALERFGYE
jgi:GTP-binding protein Era